MLNRGTAAALQQHFSRTGLVHVLVPKKVTNVELSPSQAAAFVVLSIRISY